MCRGNMPISRSAARQCHKKRISIKMREQFELSPRCQRLRAIDPSMLSSRFRRDTQGLERWKGSLLIQLRTGHVPLQVHLNRIGKKDSPVCLMCNEADETVSHFLTACTTFAIQRRCMERHLQRAMKSVGMLLMNPNAFPHLFRYIVNTRRFRGLTSKT